MMGRPQLVGRPTVGGSARQGMELYTAKYHKLEKNQREETKSMVTVAILSVRGSRGAGGSIAGAREVPEQQVTRAAGTDLQRQRA